MSRLLSRPALLAAVAAAACLVPSSASAEPIVSLNTDGTPFADKPASFTAEVLDASAGATLKWAVDCPEAGPYDFSASQPTPVTNGKGSFTTTFTTVGFHSLCVQVSDGGVVNDDRTSFEILDQDDPGPTAKLTVTPAAATPGQTVKLDASGSVNAVPGTLTYEFDADGDGSNGYEVNNGTNPILQRTYPTGFSGSVGVRVQDRSRRADIATAPLAVGDGAVLGTTAVSTTDGPLSKVAFTNEPCTITQFLAKGLTVKLDWGDVFAKADVTYYLEQSKKVTKKGKTSTVKTRLKIVSAKDADFAAPGSSFTRPAAGKSATALRKLKTARVIVVWKVTSKKGDSKKGEKAIAMKKGA